MKIRINVYIVNVYIIERRSLYVKKLVKIMLLIFVVSFLIIFEDKFNF